MAQRPRPALVITGTLDPDFADPRAEGDAITAAMPAGAGTAAVIDGAGHYPHARVSPRTAGIIATVAVGFLKTHGLTWP